MLSVIIPTLNEGKYIERTLLALKNQRCDEEVEIIVSDSFSKDSTAEIAKKYGAKVVSSEPRGPAAGRNVGASEARGEVLIFLDADTIVSHNLLQSISDVFKVEKGVVGGTSAFYPQDGGPVDKIMYKFANLFARAAIKFGYPHDPGYCGFYRREVFEKLGGIREDLALCETHDLAMRSKRYGRFIYLNVPVYTSLRRFKKEGYRKSLFTYIYSTLYYYLKKRVPKDKFKFVPVR